MRKIYAGLVETRGNFEPLSDLLALPFFPLKSALPTLSAGCCGEIWTRNLPNVTLVAQTAPFGTLVGKTREKARLAFGFNSGSIDTPFCSFAWKGSI